MPRAMPCGREGDGGHGNGVGARACLTRRADKERKSAVALFVASQESFRPGHRLSFAGDGYKEERLA